MRPPGLSQVLQAARHLTGPGIMVLRIFIGLPQTGQVMVGLFLFLLANILSGLIRRTICRKRMSFLLQGWRNP